MPALTEARPTVRASDIPEGECARVVLDVPIAIFNVGGVFHAIDDTCSHQRASLSEGWLEGHLVECPLHSSCFDVRNGEVHGLPATKPVRVHQVTVIDDVIWVSSPVAAAGGES
ncbi:MAG TPA: bifunctional 3-phenylpropionate/cinnamic acid dioxygenase ferredoxin subunit [Actinomycetes bacterium]|nr:bifunctional 3-phenylpropionate/cinnamic acid dioxygenase ferredoxin subunit [Actinomycetes bacterium]